MDKKPYMEKVYQIWNNYGERTEVGPDSDGIDLVEIRNYTDTKEISQRITMTRETAKLLIEALQSHLKDVGVI